LLFAYDSRAQTAGPALADLLASPSASRPFEGALAVQLDVVEIFSQLVISEVATFPIGSSAGGFTWVFDSNLRVPVRRSRSFGSMFAERPLTTGKSRLNVAVAFQRTRFDAIAGQLLSDLKFTTSNSGFDCSPSLCPGFAAGGTQTVTSGSQIELISERAVISASYGVSSRVDIGLVVPVARTSVSGVRTYSNVFNGRPTSPGHLNPSASSVRGSSVGIGDVIARIKIAAVSMNTFDLAVDVDARLPTGTPSHLSGTGKAQVKPGILLSASVGSMSPHVNLGYTLGGNGLTFDAQHQLVSAEASPEFNYTVGVDAAVTDTLTVAADMIGRSLTDSAEIGYTTHSFGSSTSSASFTEFTLTPGQVNLLLAAVGAKVYVGGQWLLSATVLFPLNDAGVKPGFTPVVGFERAF
jgi:hypothetical protein